MTTVERTTIDDLLAKVEHIRPIIEENAERGEVEARRRRPEYTKRYEIRVSFAYGRRQLSAGMNSIRSMAYALSSVSRRLTGRLAGTSISTLL